MIKGANGVEVSPPVVTVIGWELMPAGTVTVSELVVAAVTGTRTEPNQTVLADGVALKLFPVMVAVVLTGPAAGKIDVTTGWVRAVRGKSRAII